MNRIQNLVVQELDYELPASLDEFAGVSSQGSQDAHCIVTPLHYERNYSYPLIVWLHGACGDERQVTRVMPLVSSRNYAAVGPRGTVSFEVPQAGYGWSQSPRHIAQAEHRVLAAVAAARCWLNIAPERIYLAGFGCGGTMALRVALAHPQLFAGVLSFGGPFPTTLRPLGQLHAARRMKFFIATGRDSEHYPAAEVCRNLRLFHTAGMSVCLRQYPCGDELMTNMLSDMDRWIMEQLTTAVLP
ncbi:MAG TPA: alpha/beta hydrolase-fold protein, partial [Pirellulales bacterium]|nr:alpha/beta hydrolase-fold protein [Pirellulales bacterium]